ncbi:RNA pyrophosphohydrolase [Candidatus Westeberhardia cardiocondylae]|uniref:RNA pyrophosphohydrolase n=1 Tax=Candidatus Westeberhardia cardiocondylae TaxID=1594731 RepID=A0A0H5BWE1_9ENTR|nr:RNA pyrophosphohydrolase [Candidatus Westeberhardia cardiocondylae]MCR3756364.1 RNA pyrophosphohydrolase [Candidatus Westeberhardia cardiocondylae]CEN31987.1 RNA pyrophosphohydrolase [Candidatus Westeberhardia cardiocondylae]
MIQKKFDGYRANVGMVIRNLSGKVLLAKRCKKNSWQFPQGGINNQETVCEAMYRELFEEVGLKEKDVCILMQTKHWLRYDIPKEFMKSNNNFMMYIGQKQKWFFLQLVVSDKNINIKCNNFIEFDKWRWVSFWYPIRKIIFFKRNVYRKVLKKFSRFYINNFVE